MPLGQVEPGEGVLTNVRIRLPTNLYSGMPPGAGRAPGEHPRAEHGVGSPVDQRSDEVLDHLGGVLPVAVQQHDDVEAVLDRPAVAALLVAAVAEVVLVADHRERQLAACLVGEPDLVGRVVAGVVADQDVVDLLPEGLAAAGRGRRRAWPRRCRRRPARRSVDPTPHRFTGADPRCVHARMIATGVTTGIQPSTLDATHCSLVGRAARTALGLGSRAADDDSPIAARSAAPGVCRSARDVEVGAGR